MWRHDFLLWIEENLFALCARPTVGPARFLDDDFLVSVGYPREHRFESVAPSSGKWIGDSFACSPQQFKEEVNVFRFIVQVRSNANRIPTDAYVHICFLQGNTQLRRNSSAETHSSKVGRPVRGRYHGIIGF